ncbi:sensor histidine kinase [Streptosporangium lutulentum]
MEFRSATGAPCSISVAGEFDSLEAGARMAVARTAQEALTNVRKHARGAAVSVALRRLGSWCELEVRDTGGTPDRLASSGGGYGLVGMRERAELIGGSLAVGAGAEGSACCCGCPRDGAGGLVTAGVSGTTVGVMRSRGPVRLPFAGVVSR